MNGGSGAHNASIHDGDVQNKKRKPNVISGHTDKGSVSNTLAKVPAYTPDAPQVCFDLPPRPRIHNETLLAAVFTHRGFLDAEKSMQMSNCYDRYEFLGDAYLEVIATRVIFDLFPNLPSGRMAAIRESLINNNRLAQFAEAYDFPRQIRVPSQILEQKKGAGKVFADVFEAYVAAIILDSSKHGFATAETWLRALWAEQLSKVDQTAEAPNNTKQDLAKKIGGKDVRIDYVEYRDPTYGKGREMFFVQVELTGWGYQSRLLGQGQGKSKALAGSQAALAALNNKPLVDEIASQKQDFDARMRAKKEDDGS